MINSYLNTDMVKTIDAISAFQLMKKGAILIDIRENSELIVGSPENSIHIPKSQIEMRYNEINNDKKTPILIICESGKRSLFVCLLLSKIGFKEVYSVSGGFENWINNRLPVYKKKHQERYLRQVRIPEIGEAGQKKLIKSKILIVGLGGIGSPAALYLTAAGIGNIGILDFDIVDLSNLQRQILYNEHDLGKSKVYSAKQFLQNVNSLINIIPHEVRLNSENIDEILKNYDIVIDGTDNFFTRNLINLSCFKLGIPNIQSSVFTFEGQLTTFFPNLNHEAPCYRCLFPSFPPHDISPSCTEIGVLGVLPGIMGTLAATEAIKIILNIGKNCIGKLIVFNVLENDFSIYNIKKRKGCKFCDKNCITSLDYNELL
jgi:molybdopterin/thiamine biosynthesis adenylyltransferase/rhodanese-related sulfurtransferase